MKLVSVTLAGSEKYPGDPNANNLKSFSSGDAFEVHLAETYGLVVIIKKSSAQCLTIPVSACERLVMSTESAMGLLTKPGK